MGKAGLVGQKLAATLASTGTRAFPLHPAEAVHGDLGRIRDDDVVIALSQSGETEEVPVTVRIDTPIEIEYYKHGGILPYVLREILAAQTA